MNQYYFLVHFIHQMILNIFFNKNMKTATYIYFFEKIKWIIFERIMLLSKCSYHKDRYELDVIYERSYLQIFVDDGCRKDLSDLTNKPFFMIRDDAEGHR